MCGEKPGLLIFLFPAVEDAKRRVKWEAVMRRESWTPGKDARVCNKHFVSSLFANNVIEYTMSSHDYIIAVECLFSSGRLNHLDFVPNLFPSTYK